VRYATASIWKGEGLYASQPVTMKRSGFRVEDDILNAGDLEESEAQGVLVRARLAGELEVDAIAVGVVVFGVAAAHNAVVVGHQEVSGKCPRRKLDRFFSAMFQYNRMKHSEALRRRKKLVDSLPSPDEILRGSLLQRIIRHKTGCPKCAAGGGHPVWILTIGYPGGTTKQYSIRPEMKPQVEQWLQNYHELKAQLEEICNLNHVLIRPEK